MVIGETYTGRFRPKDNDDVALFGHAFDKDSPRREGGVYIDWGPELPQGYPSDRLSAMARDPFWVCFHWFLEGELSNRLRSEHNCEPHYMLSVSCEGFRYEYEIERVCPFLWVSVEPGKYYTASIFARFGDKTMEICTTKPFRTPRPWIKARRAAKTVLVTHLAEKFGYVTGPEGLTERLSDEGRSNSGSAPDSHIFDGPDYTYTTGSSGG